MKNTSQQIATQKCQFRLKEIEREGGIFEKIPNQSLTLPKDGSDARTSLLPLNRHLVSHNHHDFHFLSEEWPRVNTGS
jgi:hypothetical protein